MNEEFVKAVGDLLGKFRNEGELWVNADGVEVCGVPTNVIQPEIDKIEFLLEKLKEDERIRKADADFMDAVNALRGFCKM